jgi:hypothetical protein
LPRVKLSQQRRTGRKLRKTAAALPHKIATLAKHIALRFLQDERLGFERSQRKFGREDWLDHDDE